MLTRRALLAAGAASVTSSVAANQTYATTPANTIVMGKGIDDVVALDPAQAYEFSSAPGAGGSRR
jgi:peptide/nickel transport system substrate-binding protein